MSLILSYFHCLLPRFKGSPQELSKYIKSFQKPFCREKFWFLYLISLLQFNVIHLIYVAKCFPSNVIIHMQLKIMSFIFYFFFLTIFANFYFFLKIIPLSGVYCEVVRWQPYSYWWSYANLDIFPFRRVPLLVKKSCSFHFCKCKGGLGC